MIYKKASENLSSFMRVVENHAGRASSDAVLLKAMQIASDSALSGMPDGTVKKFLEMLASTLKVAIYALDRLHEMANPEPLTLEELRDMIGEPAWITYPGLSRGSWCIISETTFCTLGGYGETCVAYRYKPADCEDHTHGA